MREIGKMKKNVFLVLVTMVFFCLFSILVTAQSTDTIETPEGFAFYRYQYAYLYISLIYPENWINHSSQERGIMIDTPDSKGNIMVLATPLFGEEYTLEELWSENMENLKSAGAVLLESSPDTLSGYPAIKALHTIKIGKDNHQYIRYSSIIGDLYYSFSFHTHEKDFEKYLNDIIIIVRSIKINQ